MKVVSLILTFLGLFVSPAVAVTSISDGFMTYWRQFRAAAMREDMTTLAALTKFPLAAGSDNDPDHPKHITREMFPTYFRTELRCPALDSGSQLNMIRQRTNLNPTYDYHLDGRATVGMFEFRKNAGQWRLVTIEYGGTDGFRKRLKGRC